MEERRRLLIAVFRVGLLLGLLSVLKARMYSKCELAYELHRRGVRDRDLPHWLTLLSALLTEHRCTAEKQHPQSSLSQVLPPRSAVVFGVCMAKAESGMNSLAIRRRNRDGGIGYGIFQINDKWGCGPEGFSGCNVTCSSLVSDDVGPSIECAKKIQVERGFDVWPGWKSRCKNEKYGFICIHEKFGWR